MLPDLKIPAIKAKVDTGARTSTLHAFMVETFSRNGKRVRFFVHPLQRRRDLFISCEAPILDERRVRDSGGRTEKRFVIETTVRLGERECTIEATLTNRDDMLFRMLLGRTALRSFGLMVDPGQPYLLGRRPRNAYGKKWRSSV